MNIAWPKHNYVDYINNNNIITTIQILFATIINNYNNKIIQYLQINYIFLLHNICPYIILLKLKILLILCKKDQLN